jgi:hypothetical protein
MQIPMGNFGNALPQAGPRINVPEGAFDVSSGVQHLAQVGMGIANDQMQLQKEAMRAKASLTMQQTTNDMYAAHDEVARGVADGSIDPGEASTELSSRVEKIKGANLTDLNPYQRQIINDNIEHTKGSIERSLNGVIVKRTQSDTAATIDQFGEQVQRDAARIGPGAASSKYDAMVDFSGSAAGLSPKDQEAVKQKFKENVHANFFDAAGTQALADKNLDGVTAVLDKVRGPDGDVLDPKTRTVLTHKLFGFQQHIEAMNARDQNALARAGDIREKLGADTLDEAQNLSLNGQYLSPDYIDRLAKNTAGTASEPYAVALLSAQKLIAGFATMTAAERASKIEQARSEGADPTKGTNPQAAKVLTYIEGIDRAANSMAKDNPWSAAQKYGVIKDAPMLDASNPLGALDVIKQRMVQIRSVESWVGHKVSLFQPLEADALGKGIRSLPLDQQATALGELGKALNDGERIAMVASQLDEKDKTLSIAMSYAGAQTTQGRTAAFLVLKGEQAIKDKLVKVDGTKETGWRAAISNQIRGAYLNPQIEDKAIDAAFLMLAARTADNTQADVNPANAVRLATGGIIEFNGAKVPMPFGFTAESQSDGEKRFKKAVETIRPADLADQAPDGRVTVGGASLSVDDFVKKLPQARLANFRDGSYYVQAGSGYATNAQGKLIVIKVKP